jgi:hypothetical protein
MTAGKIWLGLLALCAAVSVAGTPAAAQQQQKPNILFIMGTTSAGCSRASTTAA